MNHPTTDGEIDKILKELEDYYNTVYNAILPREGAMDRARAKQAIQEHIQKAVLEATNDITEPCTCGHSLHTRYIATDCDSCSCQMFEAYKAKGEAANQQVDGGDS